MIHQFKLNGKGFVLDIESGGVHVVDDLAYDCIKHKSEGKPNSETFLLLKEKYNELDIQETLEEIDCLVLENKLFSPEIKYKKPQKTSEKQVVKAMCLHVAHTCNLDCEYCFARGGTYHGEHALMPLEVGIRAIDFLMENSGGRRNLEVDFFGGEPLMNWEVVKEIVRYARSVEKQKNKNFRFTLTTNGVLITDEVIEFCNREMANVVLSLDGRPEVHDRFRKTVNGKPSYDVVVPKFLEFAKKRGGGYYIRGTFTKHNADFTNDVFHMADLGFSELSMEPVVCKAGDKNGFDDKDLAQLGRQYEILAEEMLRREISRNKNFSFYHYNIDLERGPCLHKRVLGCGSGTEYMAVTPQGELFPCHQFVGDEEYKLGDVFSGVSRKDLVGQFEDCGIFSKEECKGCWAKYYCGGGCPANAYHSTGSINGIYEFGCSLFKKRLECAIMLNVEKIMRE